MTDMVTIRIDGKAYEVEEGTNLLHAALSLGLDLPYFCWHPALGSVGACRQCAVIQYEDEEAEREGRGRLVMACMTPAADGTRVSVEDDEASEFRSSVIEWLMVNHPHDCPICDEGGECHLQDMTVMTGHSYREFRFRKRTFRNQYLGPLINHEMNRCIQCFRCVRFYEHAGGDDLQAFAAHDHTYFGRHEDGVLESPFAGNLVEVCPTGVFTDKTLKQHYTRKWDLQTAPSVCVHCGLGCNTIPGERYGELRRIRNRYHGKVNGYFLCDRGRYGYEFVNDERRIREPLAPRGPDEAARSLAPDSVADRLREALAPERRIRGIGSPRASLESNFALRRLVGPENFHLGMADAETELVATALEALEAGPARIPPLREVEEHDAVLVLGEDATNTAPVLALALRQAARRRPEKKAEELGISLWNDAAVREVVQDERGPFFVATPAATELDDLATETLRADPEGIARLGFAVARELDDGAPEVPGLDDGTRTLARRIASALEGAERPLVVSGTGAGSPAVIRAAANVAWALARRRDETTDLFSTVPECDTTGLSLLGGHPLGEALEAAVAGRIDTLVILENDLFRRAPAGAVRNALEAVDRVVVVDHLAHATGVAADLVLPAATFAEGSGTLVSNEGRAQRFYQVYEPEAPIRESWRWLREAMELRDPETAPDWDTLDDVVGAIATQIPSFADLPEAAPSEDLRIDGTRIPRQPHRYSGRTAMRAHRSVHEPKPEADPDSPLADSMEGYEGQPPAALLSNYWAPRWNSVQALNRFQEEVAGPLRGGDAGVRLLEPSEGPEARYFTEIPESGNDGFGRAAEGGGLGPGIPRAEQKGRIDRRPEDEASEPGAPRTGRAGEPDRTPSGRAGRSPEEEQGLRLVPLHHVFGSEELSSLARGVAELAPEPYLALHPDTAGSLGLGEGDSVELILDDGRDVRSPLRMREDLAVGVVGVPVGLAGGLQGPLPPRGRLQEEDR